LKGFRCSTYFRVLVRWGLKPCRAARRIACSSNRTAPRSDALETNITKLGAKAQCEVRKTSVLTLGPGPKAYDLILMDPPYGTGAGAVALDKLARLGWIASGAL
jgi:16S rRNA G966 N2-methylase RsmD